jgi:cell wall-associated NlpC family hydrolase
MDMRPAVSRRWWSPLGLLARVRRFLRRRAFIAPIVVVTIVVALVASALTTSSSPLLQGNKIIATQIRPAAPATTTTTAPSAPKPAPSKDAPSTQAPAPSTSVTAPAPSTSVAAQPAPVSDAAAAVAYAKSQVGKPEASGDSGLAQRAWQAGGIPLGEQTADQFTGGQRITKSELRPGDLVFTERLGHVAVYVGDNTVVYTDGDTVRTGPLPTADVSGYVRVTNPVPTEASPTPPHNTAPAPTKVSPTPRHKVRPTPSREVSPAPEPELQLNLPPVPQLRVPIANPAPQLELPPTAIPVPQLEIPATGITSKLQIPATASAAPRLQMPSAASLLAQLQIPAMARHKVRATTQPQVTVAPLPKVARTPQSTSHTPCHKVPPIPQQDKAVPASQDHASTTPQQKVQPAAKSTQPSVTPTPHEELPKQLGAHCHHRTSTNGDGTTSGPAQCHPTGIPSHQPTT